MYNEFYGEDCKRRTSKSRKIVCTYDTYIPYLFKIIVIILIVDDYLPYKLKYTFSHLSTE